MKTLTIDRDDWLYGDNGGQLASDDGCCIVGHLAEALGVSRELMAGETLLSDMGIDQWDVNDARLYKLLVNAELELERLNDRPCPLSEREEAIRREARPIGFDVRFTGEISRRGTKRASQTQGGGW